MANKRMQCVCSRCRGNFTLPLNSDKDPEFCDTCTRRIDYIAQNRMELMRANMAFRDCPGMDKHLTNGALEILFPDMAEDTRMHLVRSIHGRERC